MIGTPVLMLMLAAQAQPAAPYPPADWTLLAPLPWKAAPRIEPDIAAFVEGEVHAGRCAVLASSPNAITVELAVAMRANGTVRAVVPRAIGCSTVEQFAAGLVYSMARGNLRRTTATGWYRAQLVFPLTR